MGDIVFHYPDVPVVSSSTPEDYSHCGEKSRMIIVIIIGAIIGYFLLGIVTAKTVAFFDPEIFKDAFNGETSVPMATTTILFWPVTLGLLIIILLGILFYRGPWKLWAHLVKKTVGELWDTNALTAVTKSSTASKKATSECPVKTAITTPHLKAVNRLRTGSRYAGGNQQGRQGDDYPNIQENRRLGMSGSRLWDGCCLPGHSQ